MDKTGNNKIENFQTITNLDLSDKGAEILKVENIELKKRMGRCGQRKFKTKDFRKVSFTCWQQYRKESGQKEPHLQLPTHSTKLGASQETLKNF